MSNNGEWDDLMPHSVQVRHNDASPDTDLFGKRLYNTAFKPYQCLIQDTHGITRNSQGEFVEYNRTAYINPKGDVFFPADEFQFSDGTRPLVSLSTYYDEDGTPHNVVARFS